jgi:hypothetical protein
MVIKDSSSKGLIICALVMIILQGGNLVGVAINSSAIKNQSDDMVEASAKLNFVSKDYVPMWFLEGLQKNNDYKTQEIIAVLQGDDVKIKEINEKYIDFQRTMLNNLSQMRGGYNNIIRGVK